jgi:hypothetical protein
MVHMGKADRSLGVAIFRNERGGQAGKVQHYVENPRCCPIEAGDFTGDSVVDFFDIGGMEALIGGLGGCQ